MSERFDLLRAENIIRAMTIEPRMDFLQCHPLESEDRITIYVRVRIQGSPGGSQVFQRKPGFRRSANLFHRQIQGVEKQTTAGTIWACFDGRRGHRGAERIQEQETSPEFLPRPAGKSAQIGEFTDPPTPART